MKCFNGFTYNLTKYGRTPEKNVTYMAEDEESLINMMKDFGFELNTHVGHTDVPILVFGKVENFDETSVVIIDDFGEAK